MNEYIPIRFEPHITAKYVELFAQCFPATSKYNQDYLDWLYQRNPFGPAVGFDAWDGDELAAHYVGVPIEVQIEGRQVRALLSLNTATHPNYQGRGLFIKLAERTYEAAAAQGFDAVFGVANANSTPGFVRKLGFQLVEPLAAKVGLGSLGIDLARVAQQAQFRTTWTAAALAWRCANPNNPVMLRAHGDRVQLHAHARGLGLSAYAELLFPNLNILSTPVVAPMLSPVRLYLGLTPITCPISRRYLDIPQRLRPSPLNFIYKRLAGSTNQIAQGRVSFSFIDFDAY